MEHTLIRLARLLHQIAYDAGCILLTGDNPAAARFCTAQYNRIHAHLAVAAPGIAASFGPLPEDAHAGEVRILVRALAGFLDEKHRRRASGRRFERVCCFDFVRGFAPRLCDLT